MIALANSPAQAGEDRKPLAAEAVNWFDAKDIQGLTSAVLSCKESISFRRGSMATVTASICTVNLGRPTRKLICINSMVGAVESEDYTNPGASPVQDLTNFSERHCGG